MNLSANRMDLQRCLQRVLPAVRVRTPKPILECVMLFGSDNRLTIIATNLDMQISASMPADIARPGRCVVGAKLLAEIVRSSDDGVVRLDCADGLQVIDRRSRFELQVQSADNFPLVDFFEPRATLTIDADALRGAINRVLPAAADENSRYALRSVLFEPDESRLSLVATDGKSLAYEAVACVVEGEPGNALVSPELLGAAVRLLDGGETKIELSESFISVSGPDWRIDGRLVDGRYPKYQDVFPKNQKHKLGLSVGGFRDSVRQAKVLCSPESRGVEFAFEPDVLVMRTSEDRGRSEIRYKAHLGATLTVNLDPELILGGLRTLEPDSHVAMLIDQDSKPVEFRQSSYRLLVMPIVSADKVQNADG